MTHSAAVDSMDASKVYAIPQPQGPEELFLSLGIAPSAVPKVILVLFGAQVGYQKWPPHC
jgi:hypothetical protein